MSRKSAGILLYRRRRGVAEIFLVHPGGPFFLKKDLGSWSIPKGEFQEEEAPLAAAKREFFEETGSMLTGEPEQLTPVTQKGGKMVLAWAIEGDLNEDEIVSNTFSVEWPPRSGKFKEYPEVDRAGWFPAAEAKEKINAAQAAFIDELMSRLEGRGMHVND